MNKTILIPDRIKENIEIEKKVFGDGYNIIAKGCVDKNDIPLDIWKSADAILAWHDIKYDAELISQLENCRVIVRVGVGYDNVDLEAAKKNKIIVCNVPDYGTNDVADHTIALLLNLARGVKAFNDEIKNNFSWDWNSIGVLRRLSGQKIGLIGLGRIGNAVALRAKAFGLNVSFFDPYLSTGIEKVFGFNRYLNILDMISSCDIVSFHTPLTKETKNMADDNFFSNMKKESILLNTARGEIVNLDSLYKALKKGVVKMAGLDVLGCEPPDKNHPLISAWYKEDSWIKNRLILTPHAAFYNNESYIEMREKAANEAKRVLDKKSPLNRIV
tara:strand:+ start:565 stop:1554 length:990 start_codon:yes stop_codon:yes gene_type:complete